ncbi:MAG TPA: hypothetical protein VKT77_08905 [Chthonomonadaceae bacterium]|nr:hypothetical protein [Chthonomonadaceae bacterium]
MLSRRIAAATIMLALFAVAGRCAQTDDVKPELKTADSVRVTYYMSLPNGWTADKSWPILVTLDGSGHNFEQNCRAFARARGTRPFIFVTPCVTSNGNDPADAKAVLAIVEEVRRERHGQPEFFLTGFSAGGHVTWQLIFAHPELLAAAAPAAANFRYRGLDSFSEAPERERLPIHAFQGDKDSIIASLNSQWDDASTLAREHGYKNLERSIVPGAGHAPHAQQVVDYFATLLNPSPLQP